MAIVYQDETTAPPSGRVVGSRVVYWLLGVLEALLAIRIILSLFGANRFNPFADFVYGITALFVAPFQTLFNYQMRYGFSRFEIETVVAMLVYALIAYGILGLLNISRRGQSTDV